MLSLFSQLVIKRVTETINYTKITKNSCEQLKNRKELFANSDCNIAKIMYGENIYLLPRITLILGSLFLNVFKIRIFQGQENNALLESL